MYLLCDGLLVPSKLLLHCRCNLGYIHPQAGSRTSDGKGFGKRAAGSDIQCSANPVFYTNHKPKKGELK